MSSDAFKVSIPAVGASIAPDDFAHGSTRLDVATERLTSLSLTISNLEAEIEKYRQTLDGTLGALRQRSARQQQELEALTTEVEQHRANVHKWHQAVSTLEKELVQERRQRSDEQRRIVALQEQLWVMRQSSSWRLTAPMRRIIRSLGGKTTERILKIAD
jgi:predicted  nucleic acid-binding Zn-ribbon protein